jgi:hypothetical protein
VPCLTALALLSSAGAAAELPAVQFSPDPDMTCHDTGDL